MDGHIRGRFGNGPRLGRFDGILGRVGSELGRGDNELSGFNTLEDLGGEYGRNLSHLCSRFYLG